MAKILHDVITVCRGCAGINGRDGINGHNGVTFTPVVKDNGRVLGWMNDGCYANPPDIDLYKLVGEASGDENVIEKIKVNGTELPVSDRTVDIEIPENVSAFSNDAGYITEHQSLANYYNKTEVYNQNESDAKYATKTELEVVNNKFITVFRYRGSKPRYEELPTTDNQIGDVWNVGSTLDGPNYVWTGEAWDLLGHASTGFGDVSGIDGSFSCLPLPHLTLTAVKPDGVDQTVQIDMSCLKDMIDSAALGVAPEGSFACTYEAEPQKYEIGVAIGDGDGDFTSFIKIDFTIKPAQTATGALSVRFGADGPGGLALLSPYTSGITVYQSTVPDNVQYFRDATCLSDASFHFVQTLDNKLTIEMWIEQAETAGYHNLWIKAYGPKAPNVPRVAILRYYDPQDDTSFTTQRYIVNLTDGSSTEAIEPPNDVVIKAYPRTSVNVRYYGGEFTNYYTGSVEWEELSQSTAYATDSGTVLTLLPSGLVQVSVPENNIDLWPTELINAVLTLTTGNHTSTTNLNCMINWLNNQIARVQTLNDSIIEMIADVTNETSEHINDMFEGTSTDATNTYSLANETSYNIQNLFAN